MSGCDVRGQSTLQVPPPVTSSRLKPAVQTSLSCSRGRRALSVLHLAGREVLATVHEEVVEPRHLPQRVVQARAAVLVAVALARIPDEPHRRGAARLQRPVELEAL